MLQIQVSLEIGSDNVVVADTFIRRNDLKSVIFNVTLGGIDLTDKSLKSYIGRSDGVTVETDSTFNITDAQNGVFTFTPPDNAFNASGYVEIEFVVSGLDESQITSPKVLLNVVNTVDRDGTTSGTDQTVILNSYMLKEDYESLINANTAYRNVGHIPTSEKGVSDGVATLDGTGKIPVEQLPAGQGAVESVNGEIGIVVLDTDDIDEGLVNLYYTELRVSSNSSVSANTDYRNVGHVPNSEKGSANGVASLDGTGKVPLAQLPDIGGGAVDSVNSQTGVVVLDTDDINEGATNLYYTEPRVSANTDVSANTSYRSIGHIPTSEKGATNGVATLDGTGKVTSSQLPAESVTSVNLQVGDVSLDTDDIDEGLVNLYYTELRVNSNTNVSANTAYRTTGHIPLAEKGANNGVATLDGSGIVTSSQLPAESVTSVNTQTGDVSLDTDDVSEGVTNLYYTEPRVSANSDVSSNTAYRTIGHIPTSEKGASNGVATLDGTGKVPASQLPATDTFLAYQKAGTVSTEGLTQDATSGSDFVAQTIDVIPLNTIEVTKVRWDGCFIDDTYTLYINGISQGAKAVTSGNEAEWVLSTPYKFSFGSNIELKVIGTDVRRFRFVNSAMATTTSNLVFRHWQELVGVDLGCPYELDFYVYTLTELTK